MTLIVRKPRAGAQPCVFLTAIFTCVALGCDQGAGGADGPGTGAGDAGRSEGGQPDGQTDRGADGSVEAPTLDAVHDGGMASERDETDAASPSCPPAPPTRGLQVRLIAGRGVTLEGGAVASWANQAGQGQGPATQSSAGRRPTVRTDALGGRPVLRFDGDDDFLAFNYPVTGRDHMTISAVSRTWQYQLASYNADCDFIGNMKDGLSDVGRELNCSGTDQSLLSWNEGGGAFKSCGIFYGVGQTEATFRFGTGESYRFFKTPFVLREQPKDRFVWSMAVMNGYDRTFTLDGAVPKGATDYRDPRPYELRTRADQDQGGGTHAAWPAGVGDTAPIGWIGRGRFEPKTSFWAGELAEVLVYDVALSAEEQRELGRYVACAYKLSLAP